MEVNLQTGLADEVMCELCPRSRQFPVAVSVSDRRDGTDDRIRYIADSALFDRHGWRFAGGLLYTLTDIPWKGYTVQAYRLKFGDGPFYSQLALVPDWGYGLNKVFWVCPDCSYLTHGHEPEVEFMLMCRQRRMMAMQQEFEKRIASRKVMTAAS